MITATYLITSALFILASVILGAALFFICLFGGLILAFTHPIWMWAIIITAIVLLIKFIVRKKKQKKAAQA